jgi:8-oxo-dGTP pyrophosphatase MutT (NUDIX family)/GNAT superfamily N-acetyltransferase
MISRKSSRLILVNEQNELFLFLYDFSAFNDFHFGWITPGGGSEDGEDEQQTLIREIHEELGLSVPEGLPVVYKQERTINHPVIGEMLSEETYYLMYCSKEAFDFHEWTKEEKKYIKEGKWWSLTELQQSQDDFFTERIGDWFEAILKRDCGGCGYTQGVKFAELQMELEFFRLPALPVPSGVSFRYAVPADRDELLSAVAQVDEHWVQYFTDLQSVFLAELSGRIVGFTILDLPDRCILSRNSNRFGSVGCVGTIPDVRGQGIGLCMVAHATWELKLRNCTHASIHYTYLSEWYQKLGYKNYLTYRFL